MMLIVEAFHAHLDKCHRCEQHPFNLCPVGALLVRAVAPSEEQAYHPTPQVGEQEQP